MIDFLDKAKGCLFGLAIGDALGVHSEGMSPDKIKEKYNFVSDFLSDDPTGSDDTEFALFNSLLLLKYGKEITADDIAKEWKENLATQKGSFKGAGFSELMAIENLRKGLDPPQSGMHAHSWSDGLAMRVAPFGIINPGNSKISSELAERDGSVTHSGEGVYCGKVVVAAISTAMINNDLNEIFNTAIKVIPENSWCYRSLKEAISIGENSANVKDALPKLYEKIAFNFYHWSDLGPEAVGLSFGILAASKGDFTGAVLGGVNIGRDTDTIAAIAGSIIGAKIGFQKIPEKWSSRISNSKGICIKKVKDINLSDISSELVKLIN
ncbi:MAG TPA: ADP-ribosylglycohydrolase family protein [Ignavibacteriaceae bacterium]|nr:ADP-ribosylglycohydrolase family protein [Ignavibacteriaceae bacterium]